MIKHALWMLSVLAVVAWMGGCAQQGATAQAPGTQPAAQPSSQPSTPSGQAAAQQQQQAATPGAAVTTVGGMQLKVVYFDFDKYDIKPEFMDAIKYNASELKKEKNAKVTVEGHCDERGSTEYNLALGERRATAVQKALVAQGVASSRLKVVSYGEERPVDPGHDEAAWSKNRRSALSQ